MEQGTMSETKGPSATSFDANVCPLCKRPLRGDPRICPHCKGVLRFSNPWWDLSGTLGQRVVGAAIVSLGMLLFGVYSAMMSYQTRAQVDVSHTYFLGAAVGGFGTLVFAMIALRSYRMG